MRCWPWFLLALAALVFTANYVPSYFRSAADTETTMLAVFYHDVVEQHHPFSDWGWGGCSDIFPDVSVVFLLNFLFRDGWLAMEFLSVFYFISWLAASAYLAIVLKRPNKLALFSILLLFWVAQICNFSLEFDWGLHLLDPLFASMYHSGSGLLTLVCLTLLLAQVSGSRSAAGFGWLFVLAFLGGASDILFLIDFIGPSLLTLGLLALAFRQDWKKYLGLGLNLALAGVTSYFLGPYCFPVKLETGQYLHLSFADAYANVLVVVNEMTRPEHHFFFFMIVLDILTVLGGIGGLLFFCFSPRRKLMSPVVFSLLAFCSSAIFLDWFTTLSTGLYVGMYSNRYLAVALIIPMFLIVFALHAIILWRPWIEKLFATITAAFAISVSFIPQAPYPDYATLEADLPFLKNLMKEHHIQAGLADYWLANLCTFLSHGEVPLRPATGDGNIHRGFCSLEWFGKGHPITEAPHLRLIYLPDPLFGETFGPPDEIVYTPSHNPVWIYSEARSILYNEYFDVLSNKFLDNGRTLSINPSTLPSDTGTIQDHSRIAVDGHDRDGFLNGGPSLALKPAHYRVTFHYVYLVPPALDKFPTYDLLVHSPGVPDQELDSAPLPCPGIGPQAFSHDFTVSKPNQVFEMRIYYRSSGTLRFDSLNVTYTGP